ncbi:hypothetical protein PLESTB_001417400 [Pleodorina starrii]|uniref:PPM-type phosphatase domain-containing protein n=1 Tax=Pleodorina starrii TaxID=330485 RepID=A0A9W6F795_9CHLO|nr:hypothetical protein PLESTM_001379100 [Pleodorina starrii]GLC58919.1 hypothetical protein PLESTB_001417400 [Pleodorina starrii]GLC65080.1 hypothetical protein PLESTF_000244500 [Pleodorina starrii]
MGTQAELAAVADPPGDYDAKQQEAQKHPEAQEELPQQQQHQQNGPRATVAGRSFNIHKLVNAARKSLELTPRNAGKDPNAPPPTMKRYYTQALWLDHQDGMHVAHAAPPGMDEAFIPPESEEDEHEYVEHVDLKAISLAGLREFVRQHNIKPNMTTQQVVKSIVIPATLGRQNCALADTDLLSRYELPPMDSLGAAAARKAAGPLPPYTRMPKRRTPAGLKRRAPYYYVVHAWSRPFMEMVGLLEKYFEGRPAEHTYVWLDVFAVPQVSSNHSGFVQEIQRAIWYSTSTLVCFDHFAVVLDRLWCLYEMFYTLISKQCTHALVALPVHPLTAAQRTALYRRIDAAKAKCSVKEDKKKLLECVQGYTRRGLPAVNNYIRSGLLLPPYDHESVYLPATGYEEKTGFFSCLPWAAPPPPPPPPPVPEHVASVPEVAEPSVRLTTAPGQLGGGGGAACGGQPRRGGAAALQHQEQPLRLVMGACNIPHPNKTKSGGEDAFFLSAAGRGALGVADGVGSWSSDDGVDPAAYSRDLMRAAAASLEASAGRMSVRMALADAHLAVKHAGSCTGLVGVLPTDSNTLQVINLGDSGMRLVRGGRLAMATRPQSHSHNMPYQLACPDEPVCDTDTTVQGDLYSIPLEAGDIVIMATDGLYDNLWPEAMLDIVNQAMSAVEEDAMLYVAAEGAAAKGTAATTAAAAAKGTAAATSAMIPLTKAPSAGDCCSTVTDGDVVVSNYGGSSSSSGDASPAGGAKQAAGSASAAAAARATSASTAPRSPTTTAAAAAAAKAAAAAMRNGKQEGEDGIGKHAPVAGDDGERIRADASSKPVSSAILSTRAAGLARLLARTAAANMLRRDVRSPFAVELSKQPSASPEFRANPRGGKPDDVTVVVAVAVEADEAALEGLAAAAAAMSRALSATASGQLGAVLDTNSGRLPSRVPSGRL